MTGARPVVIGLDLGTGSAKAEAFDARGRAWGEASAFYPLDSPLPGRAEQDPKVVAAGALKVLADVTAQVRRGGGRLHGVALSGALHSLLAVDDRGEPRSAVVTWADTRAIIEARRIAATDPDLGRRTGTPPHPMTPLAKLRWFAEHEPEVAGSAARWVSVKEYVTWRLTGRWAVDHGIASGTGLYDPLTGDWDRGALQEAKVDRRQLSPLVATTDTVGRLEDGTPLVAGSSDGALANLGAGATAPGVALCTIGTSGALRLVVDQPRLDPAGRLFCYAATPGRWIVGGPINNGGLALRWLSELTGEPVDGLLRRAWHTPAGACGLVMLPWLTGERAPNWLPEARGRLSGLGLQHGRGHVARAVLEGIAHQLRAVLEALVSDGLDPIEIRGGGGFTRSAPWVQLLADVLGRDLVVPGGGEDSAFGAAVLGLSALGLVDSPEVLTEPLVSTTFRANSNDAPMHHAVGVLFDQLASGSVSG